MKKATHEAEGKTVAALTKEIEALRKEIAMKVLEAKTNPQKDTNELMKKRKTLAVLMTMLNRKKLEEKVKVK